MNSGCYGNDISKILVSIRVINTKNCTEKEIKSEEIEFFYRGSNLPEGSIITSVKLRGKKENPQVIEKTQKKLIEKKKISSTK